jgi:hypothetical protein
MKKNLLVFRIIVLVVVWGLLLFFAFTPKVHTDVPLSEEMWLDTTSTTGTETDFEASFYQDLSDLFDRETDGYEDIQGEYGFVTSGGDYS